MNKSVHVKGDCGAEAQTATTTPSLSSSIKNWMRYSFVKCCPCCGYRPSYMSETSTEIRHQTVTSARRCTHWVKSLVPVESDHPQPFGPQRQHLRRARMRKSFAKQETHTFKVKCAVSRVTLSDLRAPAVGKCMSMLRDNMALYGIWMWERKTPCARVQR